MQVDARDLFNPKPVVMALEALAELKEGESLAISVNDGKAVESLVRLADEQHCRFTREDEGDYTVVTLETTAPIQTNKPIERAMELMEVAGQRPTIIVGSEAVGRGDKKLGRILMSELIYDLAFQESAPEAMLFVNSGVKLTCEGSKVIDQLKMIEALGADIYSEAVSLDGYGLTDQVEVGDVIQPYGLAEILSSRRNVVAL